MLHGCQGARTASSGHWAAEHAEMGRQGSDVVLERSQLELIHIFICCYSVIHPVKAEG